MVKLITTNIVGSATNQIWSQVQTIAYNENHKVMTIVELKCEEVDSLVDLTTIGVEILSAIEQKGRNIEKYNQLQELVESIVSEIAEGLNIEILVAIWRNDKLYLYGCGEVEVYLARNKQLAKLGNSEGLLKVGDVFVITTNKFAEIIGLSKLKKIIIEDDSPAELLAPLVHIQSDSSGVAAIIGEAKPDEKPMKWPQIRFRNENPRKINLWVGGVILFLLIIMIGIGMVRRVKQTSEREFASLSTSINSKIEETLSIGDLNPERARYLLSQARGEVEAYLATDIDEEYRLRGKKLLKEITLTDDRAFKKNEIQLNTIVELQVLAEDLTAVKMKSDGKDNLIFSDTNGSRVIFMNLVDRSRKIIETKKSEAFVDLGVSETKIFGLDASGVTALSIKKDEIKKVIEADEFWKNPTIISMFALNAYILDKEQSEIWKYPALGEAFGDRRRWLAVGITPNLSNVIDMKIVGDVWLLTSTGKLERYSRGAPVAFGMEGFPTIVESKRFSEPSALWVTDSLVYVLESGASRVVVFGVDGKYQSQYVNAEFGKASDLVVVDNKAYVLIENTVKEFWL